MRWLILLLVAGAWMLWGTASSSAITTASWCGTRRSAS